MEKAITPQRNRAISDQAFQQNGYNLFTSYLDESKDKGIPKLEEWAMVQAAA